MSPPGDSHEDGLGSCSICFAPFTSAAPQPVSLHDKHHFCSGCLAGYVEDAICKAAKQSRKLTVVGCPLCRQEFPLSLVRKLCNAKPVSAPPGLKIEEKASVAIHVDATLPSLNATAVPALIALNNAQQAVLNALGTLAKAGPTSALVDALLNAKQIGFCNGSIMVTVAPPIHFADEGAPEACAGDPTGIESAAGLLPPTAMVGLSEAAAKRMTAITSAQQALVAALGKLATIAPTSQIAEALVQGRPVAVNHGGLTVTIAARTLFAL
jgi:hypothetical protein